MFVFLCLAFLATVQATPVSKNIPVFEDVTNLRHATDYRLTHRTLCFEDCHHHVLNKPAIVVRSIQGSHSLHFAPIGLNGLAKSPLTTSLHEAILSSESNVVAIFPFARFPFELFPGLFDAELVVPEHVTTLSNIYKEAPVVAIFPEEEFRKINEHRGLIQVADFSADSTGFTVAKDHALLNRNAALGVSSPAFPHTPAVNNDGTPAVAHAVQPAAFAPVPPKNVNPAAAAGGVLQLAGGIGVGGESQKFIPNSSPVGTAFYTSIPSIGF